MTTDGLPRDAPERARLTAELERSFVVEAAAGTGKTYELIRRTVALLASGVASVDRLAVITFTVPAAGELKLRLREALDRARAEAEGVAPEAHARLERAIARFEEASIETIHGLCQEILRTRPVEAGIDPGFSVEGKGEVLASRALKAWVSEGLEDPPQGLARYLARGRYSGRDETATSQLEGGLRAMLERRDMDAAWSRPPFDAVLDAKGALEQLGELVLRLAQAEPDDPLRLELTDALELVRWLKESGPEPDPVELEARLFGLRKSLDGLFGKRKSNRGSSKIGHGPLAEDVPRHEVVALGRALHATLKSYVAVADASLAAQLHDELLVVVDRYRALARAAGRLDYTDLLVETRDLLRRSERARADLRERYRHVLVDEAQDTDPTQLEIVLLLTSEGPADAPMEALTPGPGRLTLVGDPKQAIYGFRRADLAMFERAKASLRAGGGEVLTLGTSHRSVAPIQALVNHAFAGRFDGDASGAQASYVPLEGGPAAVEGQPAVIALPVARALGEYGSVYGKEFERHLPATIAGFVRWLLDDSGFEVRGEDGTRRPVEPSDIGILFRSLRSYGQPKYTALLEAFEDLGVDSVLVGGTGIEGRDEIETLHTLLSALEHPDDELMVYGALTGPYIAIEDHALFAFRERHGRLDPFRAPKSEPTPEEGPIIEALALLKARSERRNRVPFSATVQGLADDLRAAAGLALRPGGSRALANLERAVQLADAHEAAEGLSFRSYLERLRAELDGTERGEGAYNEEAAPGVRVMTAHKAKGLELPVIIIGDPHSSGIARGDRHLDVRARKDVFPIAYLRPEEVTQNEKAAVAREAAEELRLAYVASTRARDLFVLPTVGCQLDRLVYRGESWIAPVLSTLMPDARAEFRPWTGTPEFGPSSMVGKKSVQPGWHRVADGTLEVLWLDSECLPKPRPSHRGLDGERFLVKTERSEGALARYRDWYAALDEARAASAVQSFVLTDVSLAPEGDRVISERRLPSANARRLGRRFGLLVHQLARDVALDASEDDVRALASLHSRPLGATAEEQKAAIAAVVAWLSDELCERARASKACFRSFPVVEVRDEQVLDVGLDLLFEEPAGWIAVDLVTGGADADGLRARMAHALGALERAGRSVAAGVTLHV